MAKKKSRALKQSTNNPTQPAKERIVLSKMEAFSGPIPPPALFESYERVLPGCADRILKIAEKEQAQQHKIQNQVVKANVSAEKLGMVFGFCFQLIVIVGLYIIAGVLLFNGKDVAGLLTLVTALAGSGAFIYNSTRNKLPEKNTKTDKD